MIFIFSRKQAPVRYQNSERWKADHIKLKTRSENQIYSPFFYFFFVLFLITETS